MTRAEWHARIVAAPFDLELRRVYADWLQHEGDPLGEFIALECRAIAEPGHADVMKWRRRAGVLRKLHAKAWWTMDCATRGGMIERIGASRVDAIIDVAPALTELDVEPPVRDLAPRHPVWPRIRRMSTFGTAARVVVQAAEAGALSKVTYLRANTPSPDDARTLVAALANVESLVHLELVKVDDASLVRSLAAWPARLRALDLYDVTIDREAAAALVDGDALANIVELSLGNTGIGAAGVAAIAGTLPELECLDLRRAISKTTSAEPALRALAAATPKLRALELMGTRLSLDAIAAIADAAWPALRELGLHGCELDDAGLARLMASPVGRRLVALNLRGNRIVDPEPLLGASALQLVNLEGNPLPPAAIARLQQTPALANATITAGAMPKLLFTEPRNEAHGLWLGSTNYRAKLVVRRPD